MRSLIVAVGLFTSSAACSAQVETDEGEPAPPAGLPGPRPAPSGSVAGTGGVSGGGAGAYGGGYPASDPGNAGAGSGAAGSGGYAPVEPGTAGSGGATPAPVLVCESLVVPSSEPLPAEVAYDLAVQICGARGAVLTKIEFLALGVGAVCCSEEGVGSGGSAGQGRASQGGTAGYASR